MSTIMRSDQTLRLVQLYHSNYPDISKHTQDMEGRRRKMEIWKSITEELNKNFDTQFTVEQYKKKLQNVQCTSRQKLQTGKRPTDSSTHKFSPAEREFIRLFENNGVRDISPNLLSNIKVEDLINQFSSVVNDNQTNIDNRSGAITPNSINNDNNNGCNNNLDLQQQQQNNQQQQQQQEFLNQQLLLALGPILNNSNLLSNISTTNNNITTPIIETSDDSECINNEQNQQASPAATSSSSSDFGGIKKIDGIIDNIRKDCGSAKRKKRKIDQLFISSINQHNYDENHLISNNLADELIKYQKQILRNQELILEELRTSKNEKFNENLSTIIGTKIDKLCDCLINITKEMCRNNSTNLSTNNISTLNNE